jgi:hypothetical protein
LLYRFIVEVKNIALEMCFRRDCAGEIYRSWPSAALGCDADFLTRALVGCDELRVFVGCVRVINPLNLEACPRKDSSD